MHPIDQLPAGHLTQIVKMFLEDTGLTPQDRFQLKQGLENLALSCPGFLNILMFQNVCRNEPKPMIELLGRAYQRFDEDGRKRLRAVASARGFEKFLPNEKVKNLLTQSQARSLENMQLMAEAYFEGATYGSLGLRFDPLVVGPSGVGKSFMVQELGRRLRLPVLRVTVGEWIVVGAASGNPTFRDLQRFLGQHEKFILSLDELDKFSLDKTGWSTSCMTELLGVLDRQIHYSGADGNPWTSEHSRRLRRNVFMVGSGTWQAVWKNQVAAGHEGADDVSIAEQIRSAQVIPEELVSRFSGDWQILRNYTAQDFIRLGFQLGIGKETYDPAAAAESGRNFRYLRDAVARKEIERRRTAKAGGQ